MPGQCEAVGCTNHSLMKENRPTFHRFPTNPERRKKWVNVLKKLNRDGSTWTPCTNARICGQHFINGQPNNNPTHPDYIPSLFNHTKTSNSAEKIMKRSKSAERRRKLTFETPAGKQQSTSSNDTASATPPDTPLNSVCLDDNDITPDHNYASLTASEDELEGVSPLPSFATPVADSERKMLYYEMDALRAERDVALKRSTELEEKLKKTSFTAASVEGNDEKCKQNTGLSWLVFITTFHFLNSFLADTRHKGVERVNQFFLTLIKLRTGITFDFISTHSNIPKTTLIEIFWKWVDVIHANLSFLIRSPDPEAVRSTLPPLFRSSYPRLTCIVDCFEIFIDQPKNFKARAQTYSNYKKHNTIKVFIGCTPLGAISFLSAAWGGRVSDIDLIRKSGFINPDLHNPGDQILADRGFIVEEDFAIELGVQFIIPAFTRGKRQLSAAEVEMSRRLASVRIHIERIIGVLKNRYTILQGPLPITMIKSMKDESMNLKLANIDKILCACASLVNLGNGIV